MQYRREIDGLRAVAVMPVILFHAGFQQFSGGFIGVDVFFVISGYLITTIIYQDICNDRFSIGKFYDRRARRILPPLFLVTLACIPFAWALMLPDEMRDFSKSLVAVNLFVSNILFWRESGYFALANELKPLLHTWSLAVEEQFYLLFPIFLFLLRKLKRHTLIQVIAALGVVSLGLAEWGSHAHPEATFFLLPTRAWELGAGALLALSADRWQHIRGRSGEILALAGLVMIVFAVVAFDHETPFPGLWALFPVVGTTLVIACAHAGTLAGRVLGWQPFVKIGLISYSAYLWHQPLFAFARLALYENGVSPEIYAGLILLTLLLAYLSWKYVETPFRNRQAISGGRAHPIFISAAVAFLAVGVFGVSNSNLPMELGTFNKEQKTAFHLIKESENKPLDNGACMFRERTITKQIGARILDCARIYGPGVAILGDSHAIDLFNAMFVNSRKPFIIGISQGFCRPHTYKEFCQYKGFSQFVADHPRVFGHVIYNQAGFYLLLDKNGQEGNREMFARYRGSTFEPDAENIDKVFAYLSGLAEYTDVTWFGPWIEPHIDRRVFINRGCDNPPPRISPNIVRSFRDLDKFIAEKFVASASLSYVSTVKYLALDPKVDLIDCDSAYFSDTDHWGTAGEKKFGARLLGIFDAITSSSEARASHGQ